MAYSVLAEGDIFKLIFTKLLRIRSIKNEGFDEVD